MTVTSGSALFSGPYNGNGATVVFAYDFKIYDEGEVLVERTNADGSVDVLTLTTHYTVGGVNVDAGGTITLVSGATLPTGATLMLTPNVEVTQERPYGDQTSIDLGEVEDSLDKLTSIARQQQGLSDRAVKVPTGTAGPALEVGAEGETVVWGPGNTLISGPTASAVEASAAAAAASAAEADADATAAAASAATAEALAPFLSRTLAEAATIDAAYDRISYVGANGALLSFKRDAAGTALTTVGAVDWSPADPVTYVQHFADNTTPGTTDLTTALRRAVTYANTLSSAEEEWPAQAAQAVVSGMGEDIAISNTVFMGGFKFITIRDMRVVALASANWTAGTAGVDTERRSDYTYSVKPFFYVNKSGSDNPVSIRFEDMSFEGNHIATGFVVFDNAKHRCGIWNTYGHAPTEFGVYANDKNGDLTIEGNRWCQYSYGETNFDDWNYRTANLIDVRTTDSRLINNTPFYCLVPIRAWGSKMQIIGNHPFNGSVDQGTPAKAIPFGTESVSLELRTKNSVITNNYIDSGIVYWDVDQGFGEAASVFANNTLVTLDSTQTRLTCFIKFYTDEASRTLDGFNFTNNTFSENTAVLATEVSFDTTSGSWAAVNERGYIASGNVRSDPTTGATSWARGLLSFAQPGVLTKTSAGAVAVHPKDSLDGGDAMQVTNTSGSGVISLVGPAGAGLMDYDRALVFEPGIGWSVGNQSGVLTPIDQPVGTVSQDGGTPTGAVIEAGGAGANRWIKYADGTMLQWASVDLGAPAGGATFADPMKTTATDHVWAEAFSGINAVTATCYVNNATDLARPFFASYQAISATTVTKLQAFRMSGSASAAVVNVSLFATGRWY